MPGRDLLGMAALFLVLLCAGPRSGRAQQSIPVPGHQVSVISTEAVLLQMTQAAGVVFAGEVVAVRMPAGYTGSGQDASEGIVTVVFRVDQAVLGCTSGSTYTIREWAGLWTGAARYHVGQRLLVFLHSPNSAGLTSSVGGKTGTVPLRGGGQAPGPYDAATKASEWLVDLRWVQAQALREGVWPHEPQTFPVPPARPIRVWPSRDTVSEDTASFETDPFLPTAGGPAHWQALPIAIESTTQPLSQVLGMCRRWVRASDGAL